MGGEGRQKTARKNESARTPSQRQQDKRQPNEYDHLREDVRKLWTSWVAASNTSDLWRRVEQSGLDNALKKLSRSKSELTVISGLSSEDAANVNTVMVEMFEMLNCIRLAFIDNEKELFDNDEREKRYLTVTCPTILEIWNEYSAFAAEFAITFVQKGWLNSSEHRELLATVSEVAAISIKLLVLSVNMTSFHNHDEAGSLYSDASKYATSACACAQQFLTKVLDLGDSHSALDTLMEMVGWQLYGLSHVSNKIIRVGIEARDSDGSFEDNDELIDCLNELLKELQSKWGKETEKADTPPPPPAPVPDKKSSKEVKTEEPPPPAEKTKRTKQSYIDSLQKLCDIYQKYSDDAWKAQRLPVVKGTAGVQMKYRMECYEEIGKLKVSACAMPDRKSLLNSLSLTDEYTLHSDIFVFGPDALDVSKEVTIQFPLASTSAKGKGEIYLKVKSQGEWIERENTEKVDIDGETNIVFNTTKCEAFTAMSFSPRDALVVGTSGANYVSEDYGKVEVHIPQDCFTSEVTLGIKITQFDKGFYEDMFVGTVGASTLVEIKPDTESTEMKKSVTIQVAIEEDEDCKDTELVVVRCNDSVTQVLDKKQLAIKSYEKGVYSIDVKGFWCVAVLRIKRIFLNMRETIKKEFLVGYAKKEICNIITYIDDATRGNEAQTFIMEAVEKRHADTAVDSKRQAGLIEVKKSRSKDILIERGDQIIMVVDGQMRATEAMTEEQHTLCFLQGGVNVVSMATEIKRDPEKLPDAMLFYKQTASNTIVHSVAIMTRDLSELPTDEIIARTGMNVMSDAKKDKEREESAVQILQMGSLMSLARELTFVEGSSLGEQLGVKPEKIKQIKEHLEKNPVAANFEILCHWRGRFARSAMADFLVSSLKAVGKINYADLVMEVRKHNRGLERADFEKTKPKGKAQMTI